MDVFVKYPEVLWLNINEQNTPESVKSLSIKNKNQQGGEYKVNFICLFVCL